MQVKKANKLWHMDNLSSKGNNNYNTVSLMEPNTNKINHV